VKIQIYGVLPVEIAEELEQIGTMNLDRSAPNFKEQVNELHKRFLKTNPGPEYVSCYERLTDCLFNPQVGGILAPSANKTQLVCFLGRACPKAPDGKQIPLIKVESN
jgi:hypothetical protein